MGILDNLFGITKAKNAAINAADRNRAESISAYSDAQGILAPYLQGGQQGFELYKNFLGINGPESQQMAYDNYVRRPNFLAGEGIRAIDNSYAAKTGGMNSGGLLKALTNYGTGIAAQDMNSYLNRLAATGAMGQQAAGTLTGARYNSAGLTTGANTAEGNAIANASLAGGNILQNLITGGMNLAGNLGWNPFGGTGGGQQTGQMMGNRPW